VLGAAIVLVCCAEFASAQSAAPQFDVASVKPNPDALGSLAGGFCRSATYSAVATGLGGPLAGSALPQAPGDCRFGKTTLKEIIAAAYGIPRRDFKRLIVDGPKWIETDLFDIWAKASPDRSQVELEQMLQALLADRFRLRLHREIRELEVYALVLVKGAPRLTEANSATRGRINWRAGSLTATSTTLARFAQILTSLVGEPVIDHTGLATAYDFTLKWTPEPGMSSPFGGAALSEPLATSGGTMGPSIFTAVQEQLGLRLQRRKLPTEVLVIDAAERPTPD
jgi:uncharacterized protein (TIGR03435 family)